MPISEDSYNARLTSEALEKKFRDVFPSQGGAELVDDLYASGVIQPVIDFSSVAEGSVLPQNLQTAWDYATGYIAISNATDTAIISTPGFWKISLTALTDDLFAGGGTNIQLNIFDGAAAKIIWRWSNGGATAGVHYFSTDNNSIVVFLRAGDSLRGTANQTYTSLNVAYRQIADVNGNLVNPLGFTFS